MNTTQFAHCVLCVGLSLWMRIVSGVGLAPQLPGLNWLQSSISEADARAFCRDILEICDGPSNNVTSVGTSALPCGIAECCGTRSLLEPYSERFPAGKLHLLKNMCFAKWAYIEMLENNKKLQSEALQKIGRLTVLEKKSSKLNIKQKSQLAHDLQKIASSSIGSEASSSRATDKIYSILEKNPFPERSSTKRSSAMVYRSVNVTRCQMRMATVLVRYSLTCVPKSILIWYCQGTCSSRSVPQFHQGTNNVRSVEDCTCCSARTMKFRTLIFRCTGGDVPRRVTWPFDCACRPCSAVPTMEELPSQ